MASIQPDIDKGIQDDDPYSNAGDDDSNAAVGICIAASIEEEIRKATLDHDNSSEIVEVSVLCCYRSQAS